MSSSPKRAGLRRFQAPARQARPPRRSDTPTASTRSASTTARSRATARGTTIAIVDAYDDPNIASDLHQFDLAFGLPDPTFTKVNQNGGSTLPAANAGWATEIALDVEWAHAIAPGANILLVEANSANRTPTCSPPSPTPPAARRRRRLHELGRRRVHRREQLRQQLHDASGHGGVTFVASSGDSGAPASTRRSRPTSSPSAARR